MTERLILGVEVTITRWVSNEPQPGIVECELVDAHGRRWSFQEKAAIVSADLLDDKSAYPRSGVIACEIVERAVDTKGREVLRIDTVRPWGVESIDGETQFDVLPDAVSPHE